MRQAAGKNAMVSPEIGNALGGAQRQMQLTREAISNASPNAREGAEQAGGAVDALNSAAYQLLRARGDVQGAQSGTGLAEALERMAELAKQQGGLGRQGAGLLPMAGTGAIREQLRQLGARQQALADELQKLKGGGDLPGAGEMADEAKDLAKRLEGGRLDRQVVERQERLFRRMLDAGRTLQGREEDQQKERQSTTATDDSVHLPPALRARLTRRRRPPPGADVGGAAAALTRGAAAGRGLLPAAERGGATVNRAWWIGLVLALAPAALQPRAVAAQDSAMSRAFELERRGNYAQAVDAYRAVLAARPADAPALLGLERSLMPLGRTTEILPQVRAALAAVRPSPAAAPCSAWRSGHGPPPAFPTACAPWRSGGPRWRRATRRRTANGARRRWPSGTGRVPGWPTGGPANSCTGRTRWPPRWRSSTSRTATSHGSLREWLPAIRRLPGYRMTAVSTLSQAPDSLRPDLLSGCPMSTTCRRGAWRPISARAGATRWARSNRCRPRCRPIPPRPSRRCGGWGPAANGAGPSRARGARAGSWS